MRLLALVVALATLSGCSYAAGPFHIYGGMSYAPVGDAQHDTALPVPTAESWPRTPVPTIAPTRTCTVTSARGLVIRAGPGVEHARLGVVLDGTRLVVVDENEPGDWVQIEGRDLHPAGWVAGWLCE
jgi:uncharacterized protein YgiM (DUF1202 family)